MQHTSDALRAWFRNVQPLCAELFNAAHVMCGNYDMAEYALRSTILDVWLQGAAGGMGFRERLRGTLRREAFAAALSDEGQAAEFTWPGPGAGKDDGPVDAQLAQEEIRTQRLVMLRHGCALPLRQVCRLTGMTQGQARAELNRFEARCRRRLPAQDRSRAEALIARQAKRLLSQGTPDAPQPGQIFRAFEAEAGVAASRGPRVWRVVGNLLLALLALLCAGAFWLFAVLVQPG
jgi:hypothetical protein